MKVNINKHMHARTVITDVNKEVRKSKGGMFT